MEIKDLPTKKHLTTEGFVLNVDSTKVLLIFHNKVKKWLPAGGHVEENELPDQAALREVREETGIEAEIINPYTKLDLTDSPEIQLPTPFCIFAERIPASSKDIEHCHIDVVYIMKAKEESLKIAMEEVSDARWFTKEEVNTIETFCSIRKIALEILK